MLIRFLSALPIVALLCLVGSAHAQELDASLDADIVDAGLDAEILDAGDEGDAAVESDAAVEEDGAVADPDASTQPDGSLTLPDASDPIEDGESAGGGCDCSVDGAPSASLAFVAFGALALRRRKRRS